MNKRKTAFRALLLVVMGFSVVGMPHAADLKENTADIRQDVSIPGMAVIIKKGGETGCNTANHEKWDTTTGGCSNTEYMKENAQVISVGAADYRLSIGVIESTTLTAYVRTKDGQLVGAGVPVTWSTTKGYLSTNSSVTNAASEATVTLTTPKGTARGPITIAASAKGGGNSAIVVVGNSASVTGLTATPPTALADGSSFITLVATLTYYENGKSVGSGESLSWSTMIGKFTYAETVTNPNGQAVAYLVSTEPGTAFVSAKKEASMVQQVSFTTPVAPDIAPVITEINATMQRSGENTRAIPSHVTWSGQNLLISTKYKISLKLNDRCYFNTSATGATATFVPSPGATSWWLDDTQDGKSSSKYEPQANGCFDGAVLEACNGSACSSTHFSVDNYVSNDSM
jgi:hypothetical protein